MSIKLIFIHITRQILKLFYIFNIKKNRIVFCSYQGNSYNCNPKYIYEYMLQKYGSMFEYIWILNENNTKLPLKTIKMHSLQYFYYVLTAKVYVGNNGISSYIPKRKEQLIINTWHGGGAYKKVVTDVFHDTAYEKIAKIIAKETDYYISSCRAFTEVMQKASLVPQKNFVTCGMPRNDIFFKPIDISLKLKQFFNISLNNHIILYAPTFRDDENTIEESIDTNMVLCSLKKRFGGTWSFLIRKHYLDKRKFPTECLDVSNYPDMQELLLISDVLITDYSSCMWDFSLTYRPCFIFASDMFIYSKKRDFYTPVKKWPFPIAENNSELFDNILNFDEDYYKTSVERHHKELGSYETGKASEIVSELIEKSCR